MSAVIHLSDYVPRLGSAHAAFAAVYHAAIRMGYAVHLATRAARQAKRDVLNGCGSTARIVADYKRHLRLAARVRDDNQPEPAA